MQTNEAATVSVKLTRVIDAPIEKVFDAWTDPTKLAKWFKPNERWVKVDTILEPKSGGKFQIDMIHQDGDHFAMHGVVNEVEVPTRLVLTWNDQQGPHQGHESLVTVNLTAMDGRTQLDLTHSRIALPEAAESFEQGWTGCLANLTEMIHQLG